MQILGFSSTSTLIIFDILLELNDKASLQVFNNIDLDLAPKFSVKKLPVTIHKVGILPNNNEPVMFGVSGPRAKSKIFSDFKRKASVTAMNYRNVIHSSAYIAASSKLENGIFIEPNVVISSQSYLKFGVTVKRGSLIGHHNEIGQFSDINPGAVLSGNVKIGRGCVIGSGVMVRDNITIGDNTYVGIGSVVTKNLPDGVIAYGNPCKVVRKNEVWRI